MINFAYYTYFFGSNSNESFAIPVIPSLKYKCYYYTNNKNIFEQLKTTNWISIFIDIEFIDDIYNPNMYGKYLKAMPQQYKELKDYDYLCFLDSKLDELNEPFIENLIDKYFINDDKALILRNHLTITNNININNKIHIMSEFGLSMFQKRYYDDRYRYFNYIEKCVLSDGFKETDDYHCAAGFLIRNMKHKKIIELNNTWYKHIKECGIQDQISFFFVKQLFKDCIVPFKENPFKEKVKSP
jgi:hypothetical protein